MKRLLKAYTSFNRTERMGVLALFIIIGVLLTVRLTMHLWAKSPTNSAEERKMAATWKAFENHNKTQQFTTENNSESSPPVFRRGGPQDRGGDTQHEQQNTTNHNNIVPPSGGGGGLSSTLFPFDPNTIDSPGLRKLGLREKTTSIFLNWRRKGKRFYKKEELKGLYTLTTEEYNHLAPYITITNTLNARHYSYEDEYGPLPATININKADSITLIRLKGIGPVLAHRILQKRRELNGFTSISQLLAVHHFSDSTTRYLQQKLVIE